MPPARVTTAALRRLQATIRAPDAATARPGGSGRVPDDLATDDLRHLYLSDEEAARFDEALDALAGDVHFEHLDTRSAKDLLWRFVCEANINRSTDHVSPFVRAHAREPKSVEVFFTVRHLDVMEEFEVGGVTFLPASSSLVPAPGDLTTEPHVGGILRATAAGTDRRRIVERARVTVEHALRLLRNGLRSTVMDAPNRQLRFSLGERYALGDSRRAGWELGDDAAWELGVNAEMARRATSTPVGHLALEAHTDVETHVHTALRWADRSLTTADPLLQVLYLFFALEALVGDRGSGEKARRVAFRRAMLDHATREGFRNPHVTYALYDEVRSAAVHGSPSPEVTDRDASGLDSDVRAALDQLLEFAASIDETRHSKAMQALDRHGDAAELVQWLQTTDRWNVWHDFVP